MKMVKLEINDWCKQCGICAGLCPASALSFKTGETPVFDAEKCTGCGLCALRCPDFAITLEVKQDER